MKPSGFNLIPEHLQSFVADAILMARQMLETGGKLAAHFIIGNSQTGVVVNLSIDTRSPDTREASGQVARKVAAMEQADFVLSVTEAWMLSGKDAPRYDEIYQRYGSIGAYPGRIDAVSFQLETHECVYSGTAQIKPKPPSKKRRTFGEPEFIKSDMADGRLANILPPPAKRELH